MSAERLTEARNLWLSTIRPDGRPHLTPIWFVWHAGRFWICTGAEFVKTRNVRRDPRVSLALEDGNAPVVAEGRVTVHSRPYPADVVAAFQAKFSWDISTPDADGAYDALLEVVVDRWLWGAP
ncbi:MAG: hypothetical protein NVSMB4_19660 [Acidimicrobiales bacterium]